MKNERRWCAPPCWLAIGIRRSQAAGVAMSRGSCWPGGTDSRTAPGSAARLRRVKGARPHVGNAPRLASVCSDGGPGRATLSRGAARTIQEPGEAGSRYATTGAGGVSGHSFGCLLWLRWRAIKLQGMLARVADELPSAFMRRCRADAARSHIAARRRRGPCLVDGSRESRSRCWRAEHCVYDRRWSAAACRWLSEGADLVLKMPDTGAVDGGERSSPALGEDPRFRDHSVTGDGGRVARDRYADSARSDSVERSCAALEMVLSPAGSHGGQCRRLPLELRRWDRWPG